MSSRAHKHANKEENLEKATAVSEMRNAMNISTSGRVPYASRLSCNHLSTCFRRGSGGCGGKVSLLVRGKCMRCPGPLRLERWTRQLIWWRHLSIRGPDVISTERGVVLFPLAVWHICTYECQFYVFDSSGSSLACTWWGEVTYSQQVDAGRYMVSRATIPASQAAASSTASSRQKKTTPSSRGFFLDLLGWNIGIGH